MFSFKLDNYLDSNEVYYVGKYIRLSKEDEEKSKDLSESIVNQDKFLDRFISDNAWNAVDTYIDDGFTGTNFDRPGFKRLIRDIESGKINMVIVKDLSRLGRDYIETGYYLEKYFPLKNVRFIAVSDGIDTFKNSSNNDISPFKAIINDMYAKDISKKVRPILTEKRLAGEFIGAFAPYGYKKDPNNKNKLIVDEDPAKIIEKIFDMYLSGAGYAEIANSLTLEGVDNPTSYKRKTTKYKNPKNRKLFWTPETISRILTNPTYCGNLTQNRCTKINYKIKKLRSVNKKDWIVVENTHEPIVSKKTFDLVQKMIESKSCYTSSKKEEHLLSGLTYCGDCKERMTFIKSHGKFVYVVCSTYKRLGKLKLCTRHSIREDVLEDFIKQELKKIFQQYINKTDLLKLAKNSSRRSSAYDLNVELNKLNTRVSEIKKIVKNLYEDKVKGTINEEEYIELSREYNDERSKLADKIDKLDSKINIIRKSENEINDFLDIINTFTNFNETSKELLNRLIKRIEIYEDKNKNQNKKIVIHYNFKKPI